LEKYGTARQATGDNVIWQMRVAWWITKTTDTHSEYVILIAFPLQQRIRERAPILSCTYNAYLVCTNLHVSAYKEDGVASLLSKFLRLLKPLIYYSRNAWNCYRAARVKHSETYISRTV